MSSNVPRISVYKEDFLSPALDSAFSDAESGRVYKPESPITPTELYMYNNDPFASPPASVSVHSHHDSFEDLAFGREKSRPPSRAQSRRKRSTSRHSSESAIPTLVLPSPKHRDRTVPPSAFLHDGRSLTLDKRLSEASTLVDVGRAI